MAGQKKSASTSDLTAATRRTAVQPARYGEVLKSLVTLLESARRVAARSVNAVMTASYFLIGRTIVEEEQKGAARAAYGERLLERLGTDLTGRFGRTRGPRQ